MASEITLKYLHPSVKTYITTENYNYDTSASREILFVADVFEHGVDNKLQQVNTLSEYLFKYGEPNLDKFGQAGYNVEKWLTNGNSAVIMRLLPDDASYAHAVLNIQYKNSTNGKTVINAEGDEAKINDVYLRPLVTYIGVNNTSEKLLNSELEEDRSDYPTTDGYIDNFIFTVYPEGRGEYYNDLGFRIRLNPSYDGILSSRVYTFEVIKFSGTTYDIIDGPYYVSFDPDAIDPNSQKSMFIENVVNSYSEYVKVKFSNENYIKLATIINNEVDPYIIDILSGQSRILANGEPETYFSSITGKDEDVHISLRKYSTTGIALQSNGQYILNISNNDETTSDIVDIADNSRRVIYNNQKYVTDYMRGFYNWLIQDRVAINLNKVIGTDIESSFDPAAGLLLDKVNNLIYANDKDSDAYSYTYNNTEFLSNKVGANDGKNHSWYLRAQEIVQPGLKDRNNNYVGTALTTGYENEDLIYTSTSQMANTITEDGYISATNQHLISYYHNFMKYMEFVANYDVFNNTGFAISDDYILANKYFDVVNDTAKILALLNVNSSTDSYKNLYYLKTNTDTLYYELTSAQFKDDPSTSHYTSIYDYIVNNIQYRFNKLNTEMDNIRDYKPSPLDKKTFSKANCVKTSTTYNLNPTYIDVTTGEELYIPIVDFETYNEEKVGDKFGNYLKIYDIYGTPVYQPIKGTTVTIGRRYKNPSAAALKELIKLYLYIPNSSTIFNTFNEKITVLDMNNPLIAPFETTISLPAGEYSPDTEFSFDAFYKLLSDIYKHFNKNNNFSSYIILTTGNNDTVSKISIENYKDYYNKSQSLNAKYKHYKLTDLIKFINAYFKDSINTEIAEGYGFFVPGTLTEYTMVNASILSFDLVYEAKMNDRDIQQTETRTVNDVITTFYFKKDDVTSLPVFNSIFSDRLKNGKLTQCYNKVASYAALISRELDGKGKDSIVEDIQNAKSYSDLDYSDYSLTTILNLFVGGFEAIVNNQGSITDYSNYSSLKYLMKTINNNLDLRSTYLTLLNVHKNNILDLSTELAKNNASVILGDETLDTLYSAMDSIVVECNYLITNIINTILYKTYRLQNLEEMDRVSDGKPYAYYFSESVNEDKNKKKLYVDADPLGITVNINNYGKKNDTTYYKGILPLLEKILINITGQNHYGESRDPIYGGQSLVSMYDDIKNGYVVGGLTQERYETMYQILSESLAHLSDIHNIITSFINEKYISEIINTLIGTLDVKNTVIKYKGSSYSINALYEYLNSGEDDSLTQTEVANLINNSLTVTLNTQFLPISIDGALNAPVLQYPYFCMEDIINSVTIANDNKDIVKSNILKQDRVLASLNTLCYDNLVTNIEAPLGFAEGSDGSFTYDNSSTAALKRRMNKINDVRIKAYKGTWNPDVINKDLFEFDHIFDANYDDAVKNAIITLARDERQDFFFWADTKVQNTVQDCIDWKAGFTNSTYFMSIISQSQIWYDEYTSKNINLTSTYLIADMLGKHIGSYGRHYPMAGSRRGVVGGFISNDWYPNTEQKEKLYTNKVNYLEKDITTIRIGSQNTNYPTGPLGSINNMLVLLRIKRTVEKIARTYQFEFNTSETRSAMAAEINNYLTNWINNGACTLATADVYASDYDIIQKIVRVDITLQFTGVIERIVINIDCPANGTV